MLQKNIYTQRLTDFFLKLPY